MKTQRDTILKMLEDNPELKQRKFRYVVASRISGVDEETCKLIASVLDEYRHLTVVDEKGEELEQEWKSPQVAKFNQEADNAWDSMFGESKAKFDRISGEKLY